MVFKNITGLEKSLEKLVETVSEGIGIVGNHFLKFDVARIKRIGKAEAEVEKQKIVARAEAQEEAIEILGRAEKRFALEQYNKQINLENILVRTKDDIVRKNVSEKPVEKDWVFRFLDIAQNVSQEEIQDVLARILSGEIQKPGSFSFKTLEIVKYLSKEILETFQKFVAISSVVGFIKINDTSISTEESMKKYDLSFNDYLKLADIGLFYQSDLVINLSDIATELNVESNVLTNINIGIDNFHISVGSGIKKFSPGCFAFSMAGKEIYRLLLTSAKNEKTEVYKKDFIIYMEKEGFKIKKVEISDNNLK